MQRVGIVGTMRAIPEEVKIEWKIGDFLQLESTRYYQSPNFDFNGASGFLRIGLIGYDPFEYANTYLLLESMPEHYTNLTATFSLKTVDGKSDLERTLVVDKPRTKFGTGKFISRSDLIQRHSELLPSGALTVICTLKGCDKNAVSERESLHTSTQTDEATGVWKLQQRLREMSVNGDFSDVTLKVDGQEFKAHKCILATGSAVFSAMMKTKMRENVTGVVDIKDMDPKTLSDFLDYLYTGSTERLTSENAAKLYTAADKYQVDELKEICLHHMLTNVSVENFCDILMVSVQHNEEKLRGICIQYFGKHMLDIIKTGKWQSFLCENPIICNELHIKHQESIKNI